VGPSKAAVIYGLIGAGRHVLDKVSHCYDKLGVCYVVVGGLEGRKCKEGIWGFGHDDVRT